MQCDLLVGVFSGLDKTAHPCVALFFLSSFPSACLFFLSSHSHADPCYFTSTLDRCLHVFHSFCRRDITVSVTAPLAFSSVTYVACSAGSSPVLATITHPKVREWRKTDRLERGRETSLAAVIGQEVGCLDVRALRSLSLPLPSQWAVSFVAFCFHLFPPCFLIVSLFFSELTSYCRGEERGPYCLALAVTTSESHSAFLKLFKCLDMDLTCERILRYEQLRKG